MTDWADKAREVLLQVRHAERDADPDAARGDIVAALREVYERGKFDRDREWASTLWPCDPEGPAPLERMMPADGAAWIRTQSLAIEAAAYERGRQEERWACWTLKTYPPDTPTHGAEVITAHVAVCEQHPMRGVEAKLAEAREDIKALAKVLSMWAPNPHWHSGPAWQRIYDRKLLEVSDGE